MLVAIVLVLVIVTIAVAVSAADREAVTEDPVMAAETVVVIAGQETVAVTDRHVHSDLVAVTAVLTVAHDAMTTEGLVPVKIAPLLADFVQLVTAQNVLTAVANAVKDLLLALVAAVDLVKTQRLPAAADSKLGMQTIHLLTADHAKEKRLKVVGSF